MGRDAPREPHVAHRGAGVPAAPTPRLLSALRRSTAFTRSDKFICSLRLSQSGCRCDRSHTTASPARLAMNGLPRGGLALGITGLRLLPPDGCARRRRTGGRACMRQARARKWAGGSAGIRGLVGGEIGGRVAWMSFPSSGRRPRQMLLPLSVRSTSRTASPATRGRSSRSGSCNRP